MALRRKLMYLLYLLQLVVFLLNFIVGPAFIMQLIEVLPLTKPEVRDND